MTSTPHDICNPGKVWYSTSIFGTATDLQRSRKPELSVTTRIIKGHMRLTVRQPGCWHGGSIPGLCETYDKYTHSLIPYIDFHISGFADCFEPDTFCPDHRSNRTTIRHYNARCT